MNYQLDLFEPYDEFDSLKQEIKELRKSQDNVRKGLFARHNQLSKLYIELKEENEKIRSLLLTRKK
jgi:hypothetical protein